MILPGTGRGTATRSGVVEGGFHQRCATWVTPSTTSFAGGSPLGVGEDQERTSSSSNSGEE